MIIVMTSASAFHITKFREGMHRLSAPRLLHTACQALRRRCSPPRAAHRSVVQCSAASSAALCRVRIPHVRGKDVEALEDVLLGEGALSVAVDDELAGTAEEIAVFHEPGTPQSLLSGWAQARVTALFTDTASWEAARPSAERALGGRSLSGVEIEQALDDDWEAAMKATYTTVQVTPTLRVVPFWPGEAQEAACPGVTVLLEPGLAFGTGEHPTTRLCLSWLQDTLRGGELVLDYGAGSGVLALAALLLPNGASRALCTDTDPVSVSSTTQNARLNDVSSRLQAHLVLPSLAEAMPGELAAAAAQCDIVIANILLGPVLDLEPRLASFVKPGGRIALSGVLATQAEQVMAAYAPHFDELRVKTAGEWALVTGVRTLAK
jgi:ribosomal protein L11 methyltransferase